MHFASRKGIGVMTQPLNSLAQKVLAIAKEAGDKIMAIYEKDFAIYEKQDTSPLTEADLAAHNVIVNALEAESDLPILSEESADISWEERKTWSSYWLVDPLDGTKEFIKKNGEFTVNIALIEDQIPVFGVVYAPAFEILYWGDGSGIGFGAYYDHFPYGSTGVYSHADSGDPKTGCRVRAYLIYDFFETLYMLFLGCFEYLVDHLNAILIQHLKYCV